MMEKLVESLARETEVLGENLPQCRFVHHKPHMLREHEPGPPWWEATTKRLSYGTYSFTLILHVFSRLPIAYTIIIF
jgi:hypothetical protein